MRMVGIGAVRSVARLAIGIGSLAAASAAVAQSATPPAGFTPLFNGRNVDGWHWSGTVHHGTTAVAKVEDAVLILQPYPYGQGGLLLTDKVYKDFELYLETKPDPNYNSGIFLRSSEGGSAYQVELVVPGDNTGGMFGEGMKVSEPRYIGEKRDVSTVWKDGDWNSMRIRMVGEAPHVTVWVNEQQLWEAQLPTNDQVGGLYGGMIGLQLHYTASYTGNSNGLPWLVQRFRNIAIKEIQ